MAYDGFGKLQSLMLSRREVLKAWGGATAVIVVSSAFPAMAQKPVVPLFPDVTAVKIKAVTATTFDFDVTMTSPYDTAERYADAFRITSLDGKVFGERVLLHDHKDEQPFTRDLSGVRIPPEVREVIVQGRDQKSGYGGKTVVVKLPGR
ncbi:MAG: hypothetical protein ACKVON_09370 [Beijerinckiaceae bacterium]